MCRDDRQCDDKIDLFLSLALHGGGSGPFDVRFRLAAEVLYVQEFKRHGSSVMLVRFACTAPLSVSTRHRETMAERYFKASISDF